jgi:agmatinase
MTFRPLTNAQMPPYAGITTFFRLPHVDNPHGLDVGILGVPFDGGQFSTVSGARFGPRAVRDVSVRLRAYNQSLKLDPYEKLKVADCGDLALNPLDLEASRRAITGGVKRLVEAGAIPLCVGGDHSISLPVLRAVAPPHSKVGLVQFDAHTDTSADDLGVPYGHGTPFRRSIEEGLLDPKRAIQVGLRGTTDRWDKFEYARSQGMELITMDEITENGLKWVASRFERLLGGPIYISIDMDALDPAFAPATGPNPEGFSSRELLYLVRKLMGHQVVGGDVVELNAPYDSLAKATAVVAAHLLFELVCLC